MEESIETGLSYEQEVTFILYDNDNTAEMIGAFIENRESTFNGE